MLDRYSFGYEEEPKEKEDKASCATCEHFDSGNCCLFEMVNKALPEHFELTEPVSKDGWCRAFEPMKKSFKNMKKKSAMRRHELAEEEVSSKKEDDEDMD